MHKVIQNMSSNTSSEETDVRPVNTLRIQNSKENHSEIERRRRLTMNTYITELSELFNRGVGKGKKMNKLNVLKTAVSYIKNLVEENIIKVSEHNSLSFMKGSEARMLAYDALCGFRITIDCNAGSVLSVSDDVESVLACKSSHILGRSIFEAIHPSDIDKMKAQLQFHHQKTCQIFDFKQGIQNREIQENDPFIRTRKFYMRFKVYDDPTISKSHFSEKNNNANKYESYKFCMSQRTQHKNFSYILVECSGKLVSSADFSTPSLHLLAIVLNDCKLTESLSVSNDSCVHLTQDGTVTFIERKEGILSGYLDGELLQNYFVAFIYSDDQSLFYETMNLAKNDKNSSSYLLRVRLLNKNGNYLLTHINLRCIRSPLSFQIEFYHLLISSKSRLSSHNTPEQFFLKDTLSPVFNPNNSRNSISPLSSTSMNVAVLNLSPNNASHQNVFSQNVGFSVRPLEMSGNPQNMGSNFQITNQIPLNIPQNTYQNIQSVGTLQNFPDLLSQFNNGSVPYENYFFPTTQDPSTLQYNFNPSAFIPQPSVMQGYGISLNNQPSTLGVDQSSIYGGNYRQNDNSTFPPGNFPEKHMQ